MAHNIDTNLVLLNKVKTCIGERSTYLKCGSKNSKKALMVIKDVCGREAGVSEFHTNFIRKNLRIKESEEEACSISKEKTKTHSPRQRHIQTWTLTIYSYVHYGPKPKCYA
ncbi:unnamed protein product [Sphenostylis stenocarpa]|uniref:Uncharacterized protein n=1 Tax=Sphenostylis stenocarpa TaxID=92480 RepID=A0AA86S072_9FABA|nr:unnamed protein product [Sphenostylis stenocarpa]